MKEHLMTESEIKQLKEVEIELFDELDRVCKLLDIPYFMVGGTLLGAVRHQGFIPWDDDIDVVMFREDLERLEKEGSTLFDKKYFLQTEDTDKYYPLMTAKLRKNGTVFLEGCMDENVKSHTGIFIDIFPMDDISDVDHPAIQKNVKKMRILTTILCENCGYRYGIKGTTKILAAVMGLLGITRLKRMRKRFMQAENGKGLTKNTIYASNYGYRKQCRNKSIYKPAVKLPFEGKEYLAPHEYKAFLTQLFGENYMELPPVDQRVTRHPISKLDFGEERRYTCHE
ncbi:LicD family protein [[Ruminococcus] lactaris]|uniref:LicD family protein n=1 Tax=[Ruminococcus] lactaris TaxID=46228 RepID=UPI0035214972